MEEEPAQGKAPKHSNFETLSKEELISKCKHLLGILKKAKNTKDDAVAEVEKLKSEQARVIRELEDQRNKAETETEALQEMVSSLTENKIAIVTKNESLQRQLNLQVNELENIKEEEGLLVKEREKNIKEIEILKASISNYQQKLLQMEEDKKEISNRNSKALDQWRNEKVQLLDKIEFLENQVSQTEMLKNKCKLLFDENNSIQEKLNKASLEGKKKQLELDFQDLKAQNIILEEKFKSSEKEKECLKSKVSECHLLSEKLTTMEDSLLNSQKELESSLEIQKQIQLQHGSSLSKIQMLEEELCVEKQKFIEVKEQLDISLKNNSDFEVKFDNLKENSSNVKQIAEMENQMKTMSSDKPNSDKIQCEEDTTEMLKLKVFHTEMLKILNPEGSPLTDNELFKKVFDLNFNFDEISQTYKVMKSSTSKVLNLIYRLLNSKQQNILESEDILNNINCACEHLETYLEEVNNYDFKSLCNKCSDDIKSFCNHIDTLEQLQNSLKSHSQISEELFTNELLSKPIKGVVNNLKDIYIFLSHHLSLELVPDLVDSIEIAHSKAEHLNKFLLDSFNSKMKFDEENENLKDALNVEKERVIGLQAQTEEKAQVIQTVEMNLKLLKEEFNAVQQLRCNEEGAIKELSQKYEEVQTLLKMKEKNLLESQSKIIELDNLSVNHDELCKERDLLNEKIIELNTQNEEEIAKLEELQKKIQLVVTENDSLNEKLLKLQNSNDELKEDFYKIENEIDLHIKEKEMLKENVTHIKSELNSYEKATKSASCKSDEFEAELNTCITENDTLKQKLVSYENEIKESEKQLQSFNVEKEKILFELNSVQKEKDNLMESMKEYEHLNESTHLEVKRLTSELDDLKVEYSSAMAEIRSLGDELSVLIKGKDTAIMESKQVSDELESVKKEKECLKAEIDSYATESKNFIQLKEITENEKEKMDLIKKENSSLKDELAKALQNTENLATENERQGTELKSQESFREKVSSLEEELKGIRKCNELMKSEMEEKKANSDTLLQENTSLKQELTFQEKELKDSINEKEDLINSLKECQQQLQDSREEINTLMNNVRSLEKNVIGCVKSIQETEDPQLKESDCETENQKRVDDEKINVENPNELYTSDASSRHSEIITELNEMNKIIRKRGEKISLLEDAVARKNNEIEAFTSKLTEMESKLSSGEKELASKQMELEKIQLGPDSKDSSLEDLIEKTKVLQLENSQLKKLIESESAMRNPGNTASCDTMSEAMSTSTISRMEESHRMKELEDTFEERYMKLKSVAIKLKKKIAEQNLEIKTLEESKQKLLAEKGKIVKAESVMSLKNVQVLQGEIDRLQDSLETNAKELKEREKQLVSSAQENSTLKSNYVNIQEENSELCNKIKSYEDSLSEQRKLCESLESQVLFLEKKLVVEEEKMTKLKEQQNDLEKICEKENNGREQLIKELEDSKQKTVSDYKNQLSELRLNSEVQLSEKERDRGTIEALNQELEKQKLALAELSAQSSQMELKLRKEKSIAEEKVDDFEEELIKSKKLIEELRKESESFQNEYEAYKIRAQSVLRQKNKVPQDNCEQLKMDKDQLSSELEASQLKTHQLQSELTAARAEMGFLSSEKQRLSSQVVDVESELTRSALLNQETISGLEKKLESKSSEYQSIISNMSAQTEAMNKSFRSQLETEREKWKEERRKLESKLEEMAEKNWTLRNSSPPLAPSVSKGNGKQDPPEGASGLVPHHSRKVSHGGASVEEHKMDFTTMIREEGEGSEWVEPTQSPSQHLYNPPSLEQLINNPFPSQQHVAWEESMSVVSAATENSSKEFAKMELKLSACEIRLQQLTTLLTESEAENAKLTQLTDVLKEEIRRVSRNENREKHLENNEYIKNVILKFLNLKTGDEKFRLVPVLKTLLQLSPEETSHLAVIAKGEDMQNIPQGWGNYLHIWSGR